MFGHGGNEEHARRNVCWESPEVRDKAPNCGFLTKQTSSRQQQSCTVETAWFPIRRCIPEEAGPARKRRRQQAGSGILVGHRLQSVLELGNLLKIETLLEASSFHESLFCFVFHVRTLNHPQLNHLPVLLFVFFKRQKKSWTWEALPAPAPQAPDVSWDARNGAKEGHPGHAVFWLHGWRERIDFSVNSSYL